MKANKQNQFYQKRPTWSTGPPQISPSPATVPCDSCKTVPHCLSVVAVMTYSSSTIFHSRQQQQQPKSYFCSNPPSTDINCTLFFTSKWVHNASMWSRVKQKNTKKRGLDGETCLNLLLSWQIYLQVCVRTKLTCSNVKAANLRYVTHYDYKQCHVTQTKGEEKQPTILCCSSAPCWSRRTVPSLTVTLLYSMDTPHVPTCAVTPLPLVPSSTLFPSPSWLRTWFSFDSFSLALDPSSDDRAMFHHHTIQTGAVDSPVAQKTILCNTVTGTFTSVTQQEHRQQDFVQQSLLRRCYQQQNKNT